MNGKYVLILDTNAIERQVMVGMLRGAGYRVFDTDSALSARNIVERFPLDAVVVDRGFCADESLAFLAIVQARHPRVARVLMTDDPQSPEALRAMGIGHTHSLLLKPIVEPELLFGLVRALRKAEFAPEPPSPENEIFPTVCFFNRLELGRA